MCINKRVSVFDLPALRFELYLHKHHVFLASSSPENQKVGDLFQTPLFEKEWTIPHEKCHFLLGMDFLVKEITNLTSNFT
jgi:hypothetical protein